MAICDLWNLNVRYEAKNVRSTPNSDIYQRIGNVRFGPIADIVSRLPRRRG